MEVHGSAWRAGEAMGSIRISWDAMWEAREKIEVSV
jgi:hypothetical protein